MLTSLAAGALMACAEAEPAMPQEVVFTATDFAFTGPDTIRPGVTAVRMENHGESAHHMILARFADGYGMQDLMAFADTNPTGEPPFMTWRGAAGSVTPHHGDGSIMDLPAGHYAVICFVPDSAGVPHLARGMVKEFEVTGERHEAPLPTADAEIRMSDFAFSQVSVSPGAHTFHVINDGPQTHEVQLIRLNEGATPEDMMAAMAPGAAGPPPGEEMGGSGALSTGLDNFWTTTLEPGTYMLVCFVPDVADGMPHVMKGMMTTFTVTAS